MEETQLDQPDTGKAHLKEFRPKILNPLYRRVTLQDPTGSSIA